MSFLFPKKLGIHPIPPSIPVSIFFYLKSGKVSWKHFMFMAVRFEVARVYSQGVNYRLGSFRDEILAAQAVNLKCCELEIPQRNPGVGIGNVFGDQTSKIRKRGGAAQKVPVISINYFI